MWITLLFELKRHKGRFFIFTIISVAVVSLSGLIPYFIDPDAIPGAFNDFAQSQLSFINYIIIFGACFFFGGIIVEEFQHKTYLILFPKTEKLKLIAGKYIGNFILFATVLSIFYGYTAILGLVFYQQLTIEFLFSFLTCIFYTTAISTFVLVFSSCMRSVSSAIVISIVFLFIAFDMISTFIGLAIPYVEPIYFIHYHASLITQVFDFPEVRYIEFTFLFHMRTWLTPTHVTGIIVQIIYIVFDLALSYFIFNLREL